MPDFVALKTIAANLIEENGAPCTVKRLSSPEAGTYTKKYDAVLMTHYWERNSDKVRFDEAPEGSTLEWPGFAVILKWPLKQMDGKNILFTDTKLLMSVSAEVKINDIVTIAGEDYTVVPPVGRTAPNGEVMLIQTVNGRR